jgi:uncharacterized protein (TIGR02421 family)
VTTRPAVAAEITDDLIAEVVARAAAGERVRRTLPGGSKIHLDRRLPFLCVYRKAAGKEDAGTDQLISSEAAALVASGDARAMKRLPELVGRRIEALSAHFGGFLVVEVWSGPDSEVAESVHAQSGEPIPPSPAFRICPRKRMVPQSTLETLARSLRRIRVHKQPAEVTVDEQGDVHPPGTRPLIAPVEARRLGCYRLGLEVRPVYRDPATGQVFPAVLRRLRRGVGRALKQAFFTFAYAHTRIRPEHYYSLGRRSVVKAVWEVDRRLAEIDNAFDLLLEATPVNVEAAWYEFRRQLFDKAPPFHYRPAAVEPTLLKRQLYEIPIERIDDPTLAHIFREKQDELDRRITMLSDIGTRRFLLGSLQVYGGVDPPLRSLAVELLDRIPPHSRDAPVGKQLQAHAFAARAEEEIGRYRRLYPEFAATVTVRDDLYSGLLVSRGHLLVGRKTKVPAARVEALLQHEVGTHLVTYYNGRAQPFRQLDCGLAGYDGLQEGLAVLSEYLVGGLSRPRVRLLAARVIAVEQLIQGASFVDTFRLLRDVYQFPRRIAYTVAMRIYRGGGLSKDAVYLRGLVEICEYLRRGGDLEPLLVGKLAADHVPLIRELRLRRVLDAPPLRPRYLDDPRALQRMERLRQGISIVQLAEGRIDENRLRRQ